MNIELEAASGLCFKEAAKYMQRLESKIEEYNKGKYGNDSEFRLLANHECLIENLLIFFKNNKWENESTHLSNLFVLNKELMELYQEEYTTFFETQKYLLNLGYVKDETKILLDKLNIIICKDILLGCDQMITNERISILRLAISQMLDTYEVLFDAMIYQIKKYNTFGANIE